MEKPIEDTKIGLATAKLAKSWHDICVISIK
jgi:hypothetical protein